MRQSRTHSAVESIVNVLSGIIISFVVTQTIGTHILGIGIDVHQNMALTAILTATSLVRSYGFRRYFDSMCKPKVKRRSRK